MKRRKKFKWVVRTGYREIYYFTTKKRAERFAGSKYKVRRRR